MKKRITTNEKKSKIIYNHDGTFNRVKINTNVFVNNKNKSISRTMVDTAKKYIGKYACIVESGQRIYLGNDFPKEFAYSKYSQYLSKELKLAKGMTISGIIELIESATNRKYCNKKKSKHAKDAKYGFYKYDIFFSFVRNTKEYIYQGMILIRNDKNGKKYLYDILNIKKIGSNLLPVVSNSIKSSTKIGSSNSLPINSIHC